MRINLTKKDIVNSIYMQIGFSKKICENLLNDIIELFIDNLKEYRKLKISKFGTFLLRVKKSRIGRNPKTKERKIISNRTVVLFKPSNEFKKFLIIKMVNNNRTYKTISEVAKLLNLVNTKNGNLTTHTLRFWEKNLNK